MVDLTGRRTGVCLGSGFFGFFAHAGVIEALEERGVEPVAIAGCSAGALAGSFWAGGMRGEEVARALTSVGLADFVDLVPPWEMVRRPGGLLRGRRFERLLERLLPAATFEECGVELSVTVYDLSERRLRVVDSGPLAPAVRASCAMPGMFAPVDLDGRPAWDGGIVEKVPLGPLAGRDDVESILVSYLATPPPSHPPRTIMTGLREVIQTLVRPADQRTVDGIREGGAEVLVIAPSVPSSGPLELSRGPEIVETARREALRIIDEGDFGCPELL